MTVFNDLDFNDFDALTFAEFDALDGLEFYPAWFYLPDIRSSILGSNLPFLAVMPRPDHDVTVQDRRQIMWMYRGAAELGTVLIDEGYLLGGMLPMSGGLS